MNRHLFPMLFATALPLLCQDDPSDPEREVQAQVLLHTGPTDLQVNEALLDRILAEKGLTTALAKKVGTAYRDCSSSFVNLRQSRVSGSYQFDLELTVTVAGDWDDEVQDRCVDAATSHLRRRLSEVLIDEPYMVRDERRQQLERRHASLQKRTLELKMQLERSANDLERARRNRRQIEEQLLEARLDEATEANAKRHLAKLRDQNTELRDQLNRDIAEHEAKLEDLRNLQVELGARIHGAKENERKELQARIKKAAAQVGEAGRGIDRWRELRGTVNAMLFKIVDQLPTIELQWSRARARLDSLEKAREDAEVHLAVALEKERERASLSVDLQQLEIDLEVTRKELAGIRARMGTMQPLRMQVLRPRVRDNP